MNQDFDTLISQYNALRDEKERIEKNMQDLKAEYSNKVLMHGNYKSDVGKIELRSGYERVSYKNEVVDAVKGALYEINPELANQLEAARKVVTVDATWAIGR